MRAMKPLLCFTTVLLLFSHVAPRVAASACWQKFSQQEWPSCKQLSSGYSMHWRIDGGMLTLGLSLSTTPTWFAVGISEAGGMKGADMMVVQRAANGTAEWAVLDMFSVAYERPALDAQQDAALLNITADASGVAAVLQRPLATCDDSDLPVLTNGLAQHIVWALGTDGPLSYHGPTQRGNAAIIFVPDPRAAAPPDPPDLAAVDVVMPGFPVPTAATTYACTLLRLPAGPKRHLTRYRSVVGSRLVHHMIMYGCATQPDQAEGVAFACNGMPADCQTFYIGWVPGITDMALPADAGFALGGPGGIEWLALQVHYNNPSGVAAAPDSSGFRIFLTEQLRPHDVGVLMVGQPALAIPPRVANHTAEPNICPAGCTAQFPGNLTLLTVTPHMHMIGRSITTRRIRRGVELAPLVDRRHWDFNFQQMLQPDSDDAVLVPGDELVTTCSYDSSERAAATRMGEGSEDEMCWTFITYYPAAAGIDICVGATSPAYAACTTRATLSKLDPRNTSTLMTMLTEGKFVPATLGSYTPYRPTCQSSRTAASSPAAGLSATTAPASSGSSSGSGSPSPQGAPSPSPIVTRRSAGSKRHGDAGTLVALWLVACLVHACVLAAPADGRQLSFAPPLRV